MNKVVSIQIAGQVFWVEEAAFEDLNAYLATIRQQLAGNDCVDEIVADIELRVAELLYADHRTERKAVSATSLGKVIQQVGYIERPDQEIVSEVQAPSKSYRDPQQRIVAGVCAGLASRFGVPSLFVRLSFLLLIAAFGLGVVFYLILWASMDLGSQRRAAVAATGQRPTARTLATVTPAGALEKPSGSWQRILFFPFTLMGGLVSLIGRHITRHRRGYGWIAKTVAAVVLVIATTLTCSLLLEFALSRFLTWPAAVAFSLAALYLIVSLLAAFSREYFLAAPAVKTSKLRRGLTIAATAVVLLGLAHVLHVHAESGVEEIDRAFSLEGRELTLLFDERPLDDPFSRVQYRIEGNGSHDQVRLHIEYSSLGTNKANTAANIRAIQYHYGFADDTLRLSPFWSLADGALNRGQQVKVRIEIPIGVTVASPHALEVQLDEPYGYVPQPKSTDRSAYHYLIRGPFLHELSPASKDRLTANEQKVLIDMYCRSFFLGESWHCDENLRQTAQVNGRINPSFAQATTQIDQLRIYLDDDISVADLGAIQTILDDVTTPGEGPTEFQNHLDHLLSVKGSISVIEAAEP